MNNFLKRIVTAVLAATVVFSASTVPAQAMTKKQVNKEIKALKKSILKDEKKYPSVLKEDQAPMATYTQINGTVICEDPFIVFDNNNNLRLYFKDPTGLERNYDKMIKGLVLVSDDIFPFNGNNNYVAEVVTAPHKASDLQTKITNDKARLKLLQNSKKELLAIDGVTLPKGESAQLVTHFSYDTQDINTLTWKSSNKKVVTVSKNGTVKAKKKGSAVISAKLSVTGKTYKTVVNVQ